MKCGACNYEYEISFELLDMKIIKGDVDFIDIKGSFYMKPEWDGYNNGLIEVNLVACPKCKTIIMSN